MPHASIESLQSRVLFLSAGTTGAPPKKHQGEEPTDVASTATVFRNTQFGDTDLNSVVNFIDLLTVLTHFNQSGQSWYQGDFNYDGKVDNRDLTLLAQNYNKPYGEPASKHVDDAFAVDLLVAREARASDAPGETSIAVNSRGKLIIAMGWRESLTVTISENLTRVSLKQRGVTTFYPPIDRSFRGVKSVEIFGSLNDDSITLGAGIRPTIVYGRAGNDTIHGSSGDSSLFGGAGDDEIFAGGGNDVLYGDAGNDRLYGQSGDDRLEGGAGKDHLDGGKGRNRLSGGSGTDYLSVRSGKDKTDGDAKDKLAELE